MRLILSSGRRLMVAPPSTVGGRYITTTPPYLSNAQHSPDSYTKDVDSTPASDKTVNRLDPESDNVQRPLDPPSGEWSRAGVKTDEYRHVEQGKTEKEPYAPEGGSKGNYGATGDWSNQKGSETSGSEDGPDRKSSSGRSG